MVADIDLPVWSFRANWANGIRETLAWQTDIIGRLYEQRRSIRVTPRRTFEFDIVAQDEARTFLTLLLHRLGANEFMFPLWIDNVRLNGLASGASRVDFDTQFSEFKEGLAIILGRSPFEYEVVEIISVDNDGVDLANPTAQEFADGARIYPLLRGRLVADQTMERTLQRLGQATLRFDVTKANPREVPADAPTMYRGDPVLEDWPDEREALDYQYARLRYDLDTSYGIPNVYDEGGRALVAEAYSFTLTSKAQQAGFRDMLYRLRGRAVQRWVPSFAQDLRLAAFCGSGTSIVRVKECGFGYTGGPFDGRRDIRIEMKDGTVMHRRITGLASSSGGQERLLIDAPLTVALTPATVNKIVFMDIGRLEQDAIEIDHLTNTVSTCKVSFRTVKTGREAALPNDLPIPASTLSDAPCGSFEEACSPEIEYGWWGRLFFRFDAGIRIPQTLPYMNIRFFRAGVEVLFITTSNPGYWTYLGAPGAYLGAVLTLWLPASYPGGGGGFPVDPFADGPPDELEIETQFNVYAFDGGGGFGGVATVDFKQPNGDLRPCILTYGAGTLGTRLYTIERLYLLTTRYSI